MLIRSIETSGTVAIGRIEVLRMHAAEVYAAPAIGEFFDCKWWRDPMESIFFGLPADVERAHGMLAAIRSAMDREFADFFETGAGGDNPRKLAASFSRGMGLRVSERLRRLKARRTAAAGVLASGRDIAAALARLSPGALLKAPKRSMPSISMIAHAAGIDAGNRIELSWPSSKPLH
jgi:hypothetical protein